MMTVVALRERSRGILKLRRKIEKLPIFGSKTLVQSARPKNLAFDRQIGEIIMQEYLVPPALTEKFGFP